MNEISRVPFCGKEIMVIEKDNRRYVVLKPIVESLGLNWTAQYELIHRDPVLSGKGIRVMGVPTHGGPQEVFCLQLEYLNGWLFKVPAGRYSGRRREAIIRYQKECYNVLYEYFYHGAAVNPNIFPAQATGVMEKLVEQINRSLDSKIELDISEIIENPRTRALKKALDNVS